jgi:exonuclease VII large subunit
MTIFEDLRASHEVQRALTRTMTNGRASAENRRAAFLALAHELDAHATAEERHFYVPLLMDDAGLFVTRHALADHHKAEKLVEELRGVDPTTDHFRELAKELSHEVRDHLDEEEHGTFQLAGKLLSKTKQTELARGYRAEYAKRGGPFVLG